MYLLELHCLLLQAEDVMNSYEAGIVENGYKMAIALAILEEATQLGDKVLLFRFGTHSGLVAFLARKLFQPESVHSGLDRKVFGNQVPIGYATRNVRLAAQQKLFPCVQCIFFCTPLCEWHSHELK